MNLIDLSEHLTVIATGNYNQDEVTGEDITIADKHAALTIVALRAAGDLHAITAHVVGPNILAVLQSAGESVFAHTVLEDGQITEDLYTLNGVPVLVNPRSEIFATVGIDHNGNLLATNITVENVTFE